MKHEIKFHAQCLKNMESYLGRLQSQKIILEIEIEKLESEILLRKAQIEQAFRKGLSGFDADKFLKRRMI